MIERITDYPGYLIRFMPEQPFEEVILLLHGLPAAKGTKNLDLAEYFHKHLNACVYILHYRGLGESRGVFKFVDSIHEAAGIAKLISEKHPGKKITLVGHSWGGLVSSNLAAMIPQILKRVILLSPLVDGSKDDVLYEWMVDTVKLEWPGIYGDLSRAEIEKGVAELWQSYHPVKLAPKITVPVGVVQAIQDDITPPAKTKLFCSKLPTKPVYVELDMDHSFGQDKRKLAATIVDVIKQLP